MSIVATATINFAGADDDDKDDTHAEVKVGTMIERDGGASYFKSKSSFKAGDVPVLLLWLSPNLTISRTITTQGTLAPAGGYAEEEEDFLNFTVTAEDAAESEEPKFNEVSLSRPSANGSPVLTAYGGEDVGSIVMQPNQKTLRADNPGIAVYSAQYYSAAKKYKLEGVPAIVNGKTDFGVNCVFVAKLK
ncbi:hypothetical protein [Candidatus Venteria ishoeyi]|uniref:Uncharacterized protein n=1 Tax=Candidatus Venteria ishoeyi TaxID=1899563 RepID=A0A1H6F8N2_9GAMM|nr:hypothetical protein [Candidatus Venteria ishoeyi]SEH05345.1 Uncharacterised protein [Candidatus Venteria ishoeyi]